jgi:hypothetical protein
MRVVGFFSPFSSRNPPLVVFGRIIRVRPFLLANPLQIPEVPAQSLGIARGVLHAHG